MHSVPNVEAAAPNDLAQHVVPLDAIESISEVQLGAVRSWVRGCHRRVSYMYCFEVLYPSC